MSTHVNTFDREAILSTIFEKIYPRSIVIFVADMSNFEGSLIPEFFAWADKNHQRVIFVGNKIDALPSGFTLDRLQLWLKKQISPRTEKIDQYTFCLASAKEATGVQKVLDVLTKIKGGLQHLDYMPKVYVMGTTNSGKSSLLNAMLSKQHKHKYEPSSKAKKKDPVVLTVSALHGTTQDFVTVEQFKIGFRVIDTPGVPNMRQTQAQVQNYADLSKLLPKGKMTSLSLNVKAGYSVWLGALARLDFVSGEDKFLTFVVPQDVTIHRTPIPRARDVFLK